jgi:uncharacterized protein DUF6235
MINNSRRVGASRARFRMETGIEVLEKWAEGTRQSRKNVVYRALFAVADGSVFRTYRIVDDFQHANEFFVILREDLVLKVRVHDFDSFGIVYIGPGVDAPRFELGSAA